MTVNEASGAQAAAFDVKLGDEHTEFSGSVRMMTEVANLFGANVTPQELKDWQSLGRASYVIDHYLDRVKEDPVADLAVEHFSSLDIPGIPKQLIDDCLDWLGRQTPERQVVLVGYLSQVRELVGAQAAATTVAEVVKIRHIEADLLADILSLNTEGRDDAAARQKFNRWLALAMRAGYLLDSFRDIQEDYEDGASGVEPGLRASAKMAAYLLKDTVIVAGVSPRAFVKGAMVMKRYEYQRIHPDFSQGEQVI